MCCISVFFIYLLIFTLHDYFRDVKFETFSLFLFILETLICHCSSTSLFPLLTEISCVLSAGTLRFRSIWNTVACSRLYDVCVLRHCTLVCLYPHGILSRSMWFLTGGCALNVTLWCFYVGQA